MLAACSFQHGLQSPGGPGSDAAVADTPRAIDARIDGRRIDAPPDADHDACLQNSTSCLAAGGACLSGTCVIASVSDASISCPSGMPCLIECTTMNGCKGSITCGQATSCTIDCQLMNACEGASINCQTAGCTLICRQDNTCMNDSLACSPNTCAMDCCADANSQCKNNSGDAPTVTQMAACPPEN